MAGLSGRIPDNAGHLTVWRPVSGRFSETGHVRRTVSGRNMKAGHVRYPVSGHNMKAGHVRSPVSGRDVKTGQVRRPVSGENFVSGRPLIHTYNTVIVFYSAQCAKWLFQNSENSSIKNKVSKYSLVLTQNFSHGAMSFVTNTH